MLRVLIYCLLFALVPVIAWFAARRVSAFERRLVGAVMVVVPTGLIVFVIVMTSHGKGQVAALSADDGLGLDTAPTASLNLDAVPRLDAGPESDGPTTGPTSGPIVGPPANANGIRALALGGRPDTMSDKQPGSTRALTPGLVSTIGAFPVGVILPPTVSIPPVTLPGTRTEPAPTSGGTGDAPTTKPPTPTPPTPSPPGQPTTEPPTTPVTTPPHTTEPPPPPPTSDAPAPTTEPPVTDPTTESNPVTAVSSVVSSLVGSVLPEALSAVTSQPA